MNILLMDGLPEDYEGIPISADFRNMIQVDLILHDPKMSGVEKTMASLYQLYPEIPRDIRKAVEGLAWFYGRGELPGEKKETTVKKPYDFNQDANLIYAAFYATYGLSLTTVPFLHWWEFMALFEGLPETTLMQRVIYWRTADTAKLPKHEREHVAKMRKIFALKETSKQKLSLEELNKQTLERIERRYAEAQAALEREKANGI